MRLTLLLIPVMLAGPAVASSEDAWAAFRTDVEAECLDLQKQFGSKGETAIEVNPFGSDKFGAAILDTTLPDGSHERAVCIYDKQTKAAELTAPFNEL